MKKYLYLLGLLFISSLNFNLILKPLKLVTGGTQGLAIVFNHIFNISPSVIILIINILMLIISIIFLPKGSIGIILATFIYPMFVKLTSYFEFSIDLPMVFLVIITGVVGGLTCSFIYKLGFSSGGINVIALALNKYFKTNIALVNLVINLLIILMGGFYFGLIKCLYSVFVILINSFIMNLILRSLQLNKKTIN